MDFRIDELPYHNVVLMTADEHFRKTHSPPKKIITIENESYKTDEDTSHTLEDIDKENNQILDNPDFIRNQTVLSDKISVNETSTSTLWLRIQLLI